jgi:hypothetical protein
VLLAPSSLDADPRSIDDGKGYSTLTYPMDLGSVSTGYCDRPVARAIKIKHAGLNLTGPFRARVKAQASSSKLDIRDYP